MLENLDSSGYLDSLFSSITNTPYDLFSSSPIVSQLKEEVSFQLENFLSQPDFLAKLDRAIEGNWQPQLATDLLQELTASSALPKIEIVPILGLQALGAFDGETIYLADTLVNPQGSNSELAVRVLLEEVGHYIDSQLNPQDSSGDEGAIFSNLVLGREISPIELVSLKAEDDHGLLTIDGVTRVVEHASLEVGAFQVRATGIITIDFIADAGSYQNELAIFSLEGMDSLTPGSAEFIQEAARRALTNSTLGYVVIKDSTEASRFKGELGESDRNDGIYGGEKSFNLTPGTRFAFMLVPQGTVQEVFNNPNLEGSQRPLFSIAEANPNGATQFGQLEGGVADNGVFGFEDLRADIQSDRDYNDFIFQIKGAIIVGENVSLDSLIASDKEWRDTELGNELLTHALSTGIIDIDPPEITVSLINDTGSSNSDRLTFDPRLTGQITDFSTIISLEAGFDSAPEESFVDVTGSLDGNGRFQFDLVKLKEINANNDLSQGEHTLKLIAGDRDGNFSSLFNYSFTFDNVAPSLTVNNPQNNGNLSNNSLLIGRGEGTGSNLATVTYKFDGKDVVGVGFNTSGEFNQIINIDGLANQLSNLTTTATDAAGNVATQTVPVAVLTQTNSGLQFVDLVRGTGQESQRGQQLTVHYVGTLTNGTKFDSSRDRGQPFTFTLGAGRVIAGWDEGLAAMKVGGTRRLVIPPELGYGSRAVGNIPPNSTLIFEVELLGVQ
jgi:hypothetical protein